MAAEPKKNASGADADRAKMLRVLIPSVAIAVVVILVAVLAAVYNEDPAAGDKGKGSKHRGAYPPPTGGTDVTKLSDGTAPGGRIPSSRTSAADSRFRDMKVGDGAEVKPGQRVWAYYTGWLTNGNVFDSSRKRGEATPFSLNEVIKGWTDGHSRHEGRRYPKALHPRRSRLWVPRPGRGSRRIAPHLRGGDRRRSVRGDHHRCTRAEPPLANASTSASVAIVTSPGKVVSSAPCAQPRRSASSGRGR